MTTAYDVVVLGAGIVGAACTASLAKAGATVLTLDAAYPGGGATAEGMGHVVVMDASDAQFALTRRSQVLWNALDLPPSAERTGSGTIWVATNERESEEVLRKHHEYSTRDVPTQVLDQPALLATEPNLSTNATGGLLVPNDSVVYPPVVTEWLLDQAATAGATHKFCARASRIDPSAAHVSTHASTEVHFTTDYGTPETVRVQVGCRSGWHRVPRPAADPHPGFGNSPP